MTEVATLLQQGTVSGKRFLGAIGSAILAAAVIGGISYAAFGFMSQSVRVQAVAFLVYATLTATLCLFFRRTAVRYTWNGCALYIEQMCVIYRMAVHSI